MRVLLVSKFIHHVGGVETYLSWLARALQDRGHELAILAMEPPPGKVAMALGQAQLFLTRARDYHQTDRRGRIGDAVASVYSPGAGSVMAGAVSAFKPDVVHYHGTCYQLTSSVLVAAQRRNLPRVATAHEYKLACANQRLWDDARQQICVDCVGRRGLRRRIAPISRCCIKGSQAASVVGAVEDAVSSHVWRRDQYVRIHAPSKFMASTLAADGWPIDRTHVIDLPWPRMPDYKPAGDRDGYLYIGRLASEKDVPTLLDAWAMSGLGGRGRRLLLAGDGAEGDELRAKADREKITGVQFLGKLNRQAIVDALAQAKATVHPAAWYENSPLAVRESLASGVPALVAEVGGMPELIVQGETGHLVQHSVSGWARGLLAFEQSGLSASASLQSQIRNGRMTPEAHLTGILDLYARATGSG